MRSRVCDFVISMLFFPIFKGLKTEEFYFLVLVNLVAKLLTVL